MQVYKDFRPTQFDHNIPIDTEDDGDRSLWLVVPVMQTRDSGALDQSNFAAALMLLGGEGQNAEVHRFGHWGLAGSRLSLSDRIPPLAPRP